MSTFKPYDPIPVEELYGPAVPDRYGMIHAIVRHARACKLCAMRGHWFAVDDWDMHRDHKSAMKRIKHHWAWCHRGTWRP